MNTKHKFNERTGELIDVYFIDDKTSEKSEYTVDEFKKSIKQEAFK